MFRINIRLSAQSFSGLTDYKNIITSEDTNTTTNTKQIVHSPSEMAFMFSRAAWADLNGKKAARLTMLLNFPMLSTLSSTYDTHTRLSPLHPDCRLKRQREARKEDPPEEAACRSPPPLWQRTARSLPRARTTRATAPAGGKCTGLRSDTDNCWHEVTIYCRIKPCKKFVNTMSFNWIYWLPRGCNG